MQKWVVPSSKHKSGLDVFESKDRPDSAYCLLPASVDASQIDVCEVVFRAQKKNRKVIGIQKDVQISPYLLKQKRLSMGKKAVVVAVDGKEVVIEVASNVKPQNYVRDAKSEEAVFAKEKGWNEQTIIERIRAAFFR